MGKRLSKIYTRTGDGGETGLGDGGRVAKNADRIEAIGAVDELNSTLGVAIEGLLCEAGLDDLADFLRRCQHRIFDLGGELSIPGFELIKDAHVAQLEAKLDAMNEHLEPLENFILPGGSRLIADIHVARSVCRRAERRVVTLAAEADINAAGLRYLNRLSDLLFVAARYAAHIAGVPEVLWSKDAESD